uniref:ATPase domain containing protein n=1 Tax=viral metagenome TaxID=1070528 RepID=A0A2V0RLC3_9ZZZZ
MNELASISIETMIPRALRGFGAITVSGGGGSGKTSLARAIGNDLEDPAYKLPFEFAKAGALLGSAKLSSTVFEFLGVFLSEGGRKVLNAVDPDLYTTAMTDLEKVAPEIRNTIRVEVFRAISGALAPERHLTALAMSLQYHILREMGTVKDVQPVTDDETISQIMKGFEDSQLTPQQIEDLRKKFTANSDVATDDRSSIDGSLGTSQAVLKWLLDSIGDNSGVGVNALVSWALDHRDLIVPLQSNALIMTYMVSKVAIPIATALNQRFGRVVVMRNEKMMRDRKLELVVSNESRRHVLISAMVDGVEISSTLTFEPITVARGLSFAFNVHLSTLNSAYTRHMESTTLSGGLPTAIPDAIQELNDTGAEIGTRFLIETRDDFVPKHADAEEMEMFRNRFMSSSRFSLYLADRSGGMWRSRRYSNSDELNDQQGSFRNHFDTYVAPRLVNEEQGQDVWAELFAIQDKK